MKSYLLATGSAVGLCLAASGALSADTVTFWQFSTNENDIAAWNDTIAAFEAANPDVDVVMEIVPWGEQQQRLVTALTAGGLPDVSMMGNNVVAQFQAIGALAPLDDAFAAYDAANGTDVAADVWPGDKGYYYLADHWWGAPVSVETRALYYRKDLFEAADLDPEAPPQTWEELRAAARTLSEAGGDETRGIALSMSLDYFTLHNFMSAYLGYGARLLNEDGTCGLDTPEFKQALDVYVGMYADGSTHPDAPTMDGGTFRRGFLDGDYAMILSDPSLHRDLTVENPAFLDDIGIAMVPAGPARRAGFLGGWPLVMWEASQNKEAAGEWIMFATHDGLADLATKGGFIPGSSSLAAGSPWDAYPFPLFVEQLQDALPYQYPSEAIPQMGQMEPDLIQTAIQAVALEQQTPDEATAQLCATMNEILAR